MSSRLYLDQERKLFVVLSYAGGTKYFRQLTELSLKSFVPVDFKGTSPIHKTYEVIQVVREPISRYMSWFDKQHIKPMWKKTDIDFSKWVNRLITKEWADSFFNQAKYSCHYDGHTNFQSIWPKINMASIWNENWQYLKMEDINPFFLKEPSIEIFRDPREYIGVWETLNPVMKDYVLSKIKDMYDLEIDWYNSLNFIKID